MITLSSFSLVSRFYGKKVSRVRKRFNNIIAKTGGRRSRSSSPGPLSNNGTGFGNNAKPCAHDRNIVIDYIGLSIKPTQNSDPTSTSNANYELVRSILGDRVSIEATQGRGFSVYQGFRNQDNTIFLGTSANNSNPSLKLSGEEGVNILEELSRNTNLRGYLTISQISFSLESNSFCHRMEKNTWEDLIKNLILNKRRVNPSIEMLSGQVLMINKSTSEVNCKIIPEFSDSNTLIKTRFEAKMKSNSSNLVLSNFNLVIASGNTPRFEDYVGSKVMTLFRELYQNNEISKELARTFSQHFNNVYLARQITAQALGTTQQADGDPALVNALTNVDLKTFRGAFTSIFKKLEDPLYTEQACALFLHLFKTNIMNSNVISGNLDILNKLLGMIENGRLSLNAIPAVSSNVSVSPEQQQEQEQQQQEQEAQARAETQSRVQAEVTELREQAAQLLAQVDETRNNRDKGFLEGKADALNTRARELEENLT